MPSPLAVLDTLLYDALRTSSVIVALLGTSGVRMFDRAVDVRGNVSRMSQLGKQVWIVPADSRTDFEDSSGAVQFTRVYEVGFAVGTLKVADARDIEWVITRALLNLSMLRKADNSGDLDQTGLAPLWIETLGVRGTDPEREPLDDPQEWRDVCDVELIARGAIADIKVTS